MKLTNQNLSFPVKTFKARITHFTPRNSTAMEWVVLQSAQFIEKNPKYKDVSVANFFTEILKISDPDLLVLPCINNLMDVDALMRSGAIYDDVDLAEVRMSELQLTAVGREMQQRGLLPGAETESDVVFLHNLFNQNLSLKKGAVLNETPTGVKISAVDDYEDAPMPTQLIRNFLLDEKNAQSINWMNTNTEIREVIDATNESDNNIMWENHACSVEITADGKISAGKYDADVVDKIIDFIEMDSRNNRNVASQLPNLVLHDVDSAYSKLSLTRHLFEVIRLELHGSALSLINSKLIEVDASDLQGKSNQIVVLYGVDEFSCEFLEKQKLFVVSIPERDDLNKILGSTVFAAKNVQYLLNSVEVYASATKKSIPLALKPKTMSLDFDAFMREIVSLYTKQNDDVMFILPMLGENDLFVDFVKNMLDAKENDMNAIISCLESLATRCRKFFGKLFLSGKVESELLFEKWGVPELNTSDVIRTIKDFISHDYIKSNANLLSNGLKRILDKWTDVQGFEKYLQFLELVESTSVLRNADVYSALSKDIFVSTLMGAFGQLPVKMLQLTGIERSLLDLQTAHNDLQKELSRIEYDSKMTDSQKKTALLQNKADLLKLNALVAQNKKARANLQKYLEKRASLQETLFGNLDNLEKWHFDSLEQSMSIIRDVGSSITPYLGALGSDFDEIYVTDTCAIMHHPEMLDSFKTNKSAFVVPKEVLRELDGLKKDPERAPLAQKAARKINECRDSKKCGVNWLFIEDGDEHLLPMEYRGTDKVKGDDLILSVALKFKIRNPILLVDDINFSNKIYGEYLRQMTSEDFVNKFQKKRS